MRKVFYFICIMLTLCLFACSHEEDWEDGIPYVTFTANQEQTFKFYNYNENLEYSVGDGEWVALGTEKITFGGSHGKLRLRGKNSKGTRGACTFGNTDVSVACSGDIRTLLDYENYKIVDTSQATFIELFNGATNLTSAPELPATILAESCYSYMFNKCTSLKKAPELPATKLSIGCYHQMFYGCTSLTNPPKLPATQLAMNCYESMFWNCTSLKKAPDLPATTLAESCYSHMFDGCISMVQFPKLPATTLALHCYAGMFSDCVSLENAPALTANQLADMCYVGIFSGCKSLKEVIMLGVDNLSSYTLGDWLYGTSSNGVVYKSPNADASLIPVPSGWEVMDYSR